MKIVSMYLPQFYESEENNEWWGKGYTDWVAVKRAMPIFKGHNQPREPLGDRYYNLLEKETLIWQLKLMKKYNIYGQCFYHYWFKNGKRILDKPAENLLKWKDIHMPFCFSWANESWVRSWSAIVDSNVWAQKFEPSKTGAEGNGVLLEQGYGGKSAWKQHFDYLLPFFKDERYIKIHGKPVFMFYRSDNIPCLTEMIDCWNQWGKDSGFPGIYCIGGNASSKRALDAVYFHATGSMFPPNYYKTDKSVRTISYEEVWKYIIAQGKMSEKGTYIGGIVDFDTTPRKGKNGVVITGCDSSIYEKYLKKLLNINEKLGSEITFINAWNEWGEGMYLEPDKKNSFAFLSATKRALETYVDEYEDDEEKDSAELLKFYKNRMEQYKKNWLILDQWLRRNEQKRPIAGTLSRMGVHIIAIYGMGILGQHLRAALEGSDIVVKYAIDSRKQGNIKEIPVLGLDDEFPEVDVIIVSVVFEFDNIAKDLKKRTHIPVWSLEEILFEEEVAD